MTDLSYLPPLDIDQQDPWVWVTSLSSDEEAYLILANREQGRHPLDFRLVMTPGWHSITVGPAKTVIFSDESEELARSTGRSLAINCAIIKERSQAEFDEFIQHLEKGEREFHALRPKREKYDATDSQEGQRS